MTARGIDVMLGQEEPRAPEQNQRFLFLGKPLGSLLAEYLLGQ